MRVRFCVALAFALPGASALASRSAPPAFTSAVVSPLGAPVRGITVGPIENALHPDRGYGSAACVETLQQVRQLGGTWVSITPFGRIWDLRPSGIDPTFEASFRDNRRAVQKAIEDAHAQDLQVMLVPHLWVESGGWRGEIDFETEQEWAHWADAYRRFVLLWAELARDTRVELFSVGVELRSWVTSSHAPSFFEVIGAVRSVYPGPLTYAANWDDAETTPLWSALDVIGINAFYPLADEPGAGLQQMLAQSAKLSEEVGALSARWDKPVLFTEIGYTARPDPALRPWEWPEDLGDVPYEPWAQADAYGALLAPFLEHDWFLGFFVWRVYADPFDASQEPEWGFSPLYKPAEGVLRSAFGSTWGADRWRHRRSPLD